jgi:hypothetical protein
VPRARTETGGIDLRKLPIIQFRKLGPNYGLSNHPVFAELTPVDHPTLEVDIRTKGKKRLEIILHEALHIAVPGMPEQVVLYAARYLAKVLWHLQYRADEDWHNEHYGQSEKEG